MKFYISIFDICICTFSWDTIISFVCLFSDSQDNCEMCEEALVQLESIDDDAEAVGVRVVKTDDKEISDEFGIDKFPAVIYFENQDPSIYDGKGNFLQCIVFI